MPTSLLAIVLILHFSTSALYAVLIFTHRSSLTRANILPILCIPVFGILGGLTAELVQKFMPAHETTEVAEPTVLQEDIYWKSIKNNDAGQNIVPLEEALIINDRSARKELILEMLLDNPMKNIDILLLARENNDADTAHYANTTIAKIQRDFQLQVQKLASEHAANPDDVVILNNYIDTLGHFIDSGLSEAFLLKMQHILYGELLEKKISLEGVTKGVLHKKIRNCLSLNDINSAADANKILIDNFPEDEQTWINALQISVAGHDAFRLQDTIQEIYKRDIKWSRAGKEQISTWVEIK